MTAIFVAIGAAAAWLLNGIHRSRRKQGLALRALDSLDAEVERRRRLLPELAEVDARHSGEGTEVERNLAVSEERIAAAWRWYASAYADFHRVRQGWPGWLVKSLVPSGRLTERAKLPESGPLLLGMGMARCPNCSAPLQLDERERCPYCRTDLLRAL